MTEHGGSVHNLYAQLLLREGHSQRVTVERNSHAAEMLHMCAVCYLANTEIQ